LFGIANAFSFIFEDMIIGVSLDSLIVNRLYPATSNNICNRRVGLGEVVNRRTNVGGNIIVSILGNCPGKGSDGIRCNLCIRRSISKLLGDISNIFIGRCRTSCAERGQSRSLVGQLRGEDAVQILRRGAGVVRGSVDASLRLDIRLGKNGNVVLTCRLECIRSSLGIRSNVVCRKQSCSGCSQLNR